MDDKCFPRPWSASGAVHWSPLPRYHSYYGPQHLLRLSMAVAASRCCCWETALPEPDYWSETEPCCVGCCSVSSWTCRDLQSGKKKRANKNIPKSYFLAPLKIRKGGEFSPGNNTQRRILNASLPILESKPAAAAFGPDDVAAVTF